MTLFLLEQVECGLIGSQTLLIESEYQCGADERDDQPGEASGYIVTSILLLRENGKNWFNLSSDERLFLANNAIELNRNDAIGEYCEQEINDGNGTEATLTAREK